MNSDVRYPIGKFSMPTSISPQDREAAIQNIAELPLKLRAAVRNLSDSQLDNPYREGGWTVRQTIHHVADSHMQASGRFRMALTEDWPTVAPYQEALWAELSDARTLPVDVSLQLLEAIHTRWTAILRSISDDDWSRRGYSHPQNGRQSLEQIAALYAWHGRHHTAHISGLRERMGW